MEVKGIIKAQQEQNILNEIYNQQQFKLKDECPMCEGYGDIYDELDLEEPHKECERCYGTGSFYT